MNKVYTLSELEDIRKKHKCECYRNNFKLCVLGPVEMYEHDGGEYVEGKSEKQWIYFTCQKCGYEWALWKILNKIDKEE